MASIPVRAVLYTVFISFSISPTIQAAEPFLINASKSARTSWPFVINTWNFVNATAKAWDILSNQVTPGSALDAVEEGCSVCEVLRCDGSVGYGGSPDENGETTLDAMIMDGITHDVGAVGCLKRVKSAISVARKVMEHTTHTLLVGEAATTFAINMGFKVENLTTIDSIKIHDDWLANSCQPNYWKNVQPDPATSCGPYEPAKNFFERSVASEGKNFGAENHDTIGMIAIDSVGHIAGGTSTNGATHKIPGRVGDSPIPGSGAYVDKAVGGAAATGDGDVMMRFMPALIAVEDMRSGFQPHVAAELALSRIAKYYPDYVGGLIAVNIDGEFGAACHGLTSFPYSVANDELGTAMVMSVDCFA